MKKGITLGFVLLLVLINSMFISAITGSIGNAKMVLYPEVNGWTNTVIEKTVLVKNVNDVPINITLELDENATKFIEIIDKSFILEPGEELKAKFEVKVKKEGKYEGRINVFFRPTEGKESGVVLSSNIVVIASKDNGYEEENEEESNEENTDDNPNTTEIENNNGNKTNNVLILLSISTIVLFLLLLMLAYIANKKKGKKLNQKRRTHK